MGFLEWGELGFKSQLFHSFVSHVSVGGLPDLWPSWTSTALSVKWAHPLSYMAPVRLDELGKSLGTC